MYLVILFPGYRVEPDEDILEKEGFIHLFSCSNVLFKSFISNYKMYYAMKH